MAGYDAIRLEYISADDLQAVGIGPWQVGKMVVNGLRLLSKNLAAQENAPDRNEDSPDWAAYASERPRPHDH